MKRKIICIVGPTASGKTRLGVELAKKFNGEIISADSRQVYKKLDLGTGKDLKEYGEIKYHLIDICEPEEKFTMFDWVERARVIIEDMFEREKLPVVVGGTGLYIQALLEGFEQKKGKQGGIKGNKGRELYSRQELEEKSLKELQRIYAPRPTPHARLDLNNPRRLIRAIEIAQEGTCITKNKPDFEVLQIGISLPRPVLYEKIDKRVDDRFKAGMLEEVKGLLNSGVSPDWLKSLGLEYRIIGNYILAQNEKRIAYNHNVKFKNENTTQEFQEMAQELKWKTHGYARRQLTWFRRFPEIKWIKSPREAGKLTAEFLEN